MKRRPCEKCWLVSTADPDGMCASCRRVWTKPSFDEALAQITPEQRELICELYRAGTAWTNIGTAVRGRYGAGPEGWGWHWALLLAAHDALHTSAR